MRAVLIASAFIVVALICGVAYWFYGYTGDLPNIDQLAQFAPTVTSTAFDRCTEMSGQAIPASEINQDIRNAIAVTQVASTNDRFAFWIASQQICPLPSSGWQLLSKSERLGNHLKRRFNSEQLLAIDVNTLRFLDAVGLQGEAQAVFHKPAKDLELHEVAFIFGNLYKFNLQPTVAKDRRDGLLDIMAAKGLITAAQAEVAKAKPLPDVGSP